MPRCQRSLHNRTHRMNHIPAGQVVPRRDFRLSGLLFMPLYLHDLRTFFSHLDSGKRMNAVINTGVTWSVAPGHTAVGLTQQIDTITRLLENGCIGGLRKKIQMND